MRRIALLLSVLSPVAASAQDATPVDAGSQYSFLIPLSAMLAVFYFLIFRPQQQKKMKEHQALLGSLKKGDDVITGGGIHGKITKIETDGQIIVVEIAKGVEVRVSKHSVTSVMGREVVKPAAPEKKKNGNVKNDNTVVSRENVANDN